MHYLKVAAVVVFGVANGLLHAQPPAGGQPGGGPPGTQPGGGPPGGMGFGFGGNNRLNDVKKQMQATDEEWKVIGPKLQKVIAARQAATADSREGGGFGAGGFGGFGPPSNGAFSGPGGVGGPGFGSGGFGAGGGAPGGGRRGPPGANPQFGPPPVDDPANKDKKPAEVPPGAAPPKDAPSKDAPPTVPSPPVGPMSVRGEQAPSSNPLVQAQTELKNAIAEKVSPSEIQEKIAAVRKAREKVRAEHQAAQRELLEMLTAEQEAVLIGWGYLE